MTDEQWLAVRTLLGSRDAYAAASATDFAALNAEQKRALTRGLRARGRNVPHALRA